MAPQRGADGLLEALRKAPSARLCLALGAVAALLALAGCGGGKEEPAQGGGSAASAPAQAKGGPRGGEGAAPDRESAQLKRERAAAEAAIEGKAPPGGNGGGKEGPRIKPPKGPREPGPTPQQRAAATMVSMALASPAVQPGGPESTGILPPAHTCDGNNTPPPLQWQGVPAGTEELVLLALNLEPVNEAFFFNWAVAGIDPTLTELAPGRLPRGAVVGKNSFGKSGYGICPAKAPETIIFALYAMPSPTGARKGFDPAALRERALAQSGDAGIMAVSYGG